ncbi:hypothetical protein BH688_01125 [Kushneria phosphatilytica]|nr:hypothetical protein BH688_01125 [Kushneria phosphatilytica]
MDAEKRPAGRFFDQHDSGGILTGWSWWRGQCLCHANAAGIVCNIACWHDMASPIEQNRSPGPVLFMLQN